MIERTLSSLLLFCCGAIDAQERVTVGEHEFHRRELANGLRAAVVRDSGEQVSVFIVIGAGKRHETPEMTGLAHLTEHAMYAGTAKLGLGQHDRRIQAMGGESNAFTRTDYTLFYDHEVPAGQLATVLAMEADRLRGLTFDEKSVLFERERLRIEEENTWKPTDARQELLESRVFKTHPYGAGVLDANGHTKAPGLGIPAVRAFYDRYYQPDNTAVVVVGPIEPKAGLDAIEAAFGHLERGPKRPPIPTEADVSEARVEKIPTDLPAERWNFVWLVPAMGHADRPALDVLAKLLARRTTSDDVPFDATMGERVDQELFQLAATGPKARAELEKLVERARTEPFDEGEVEQVVDLLADDFASLPLRARPYFSLAGTFGVYEVLDQVPHLAGYEAAVRAVDSDRVTEVARRHLDPERCVTVVFERGAAEQKPLPTDPRELQNAAEEATDAGDLDRAITAYTRLLEMGPNRMFQVIYLASRGQVYVKQKNYDRAIADYEAALKVVDYPAVRDLLKEARELKKGG